MKKVLAILALCTAVLLLSGTAAADLMIYGTTGTFDCNGVVTGCNDGVAGPGGSSSITIGTGTSTFTLTFEGLIGGVIAPPLSSVGFGDIDISTKTGFSGGATVSGSPTFTLTITQFLPSSGTGSIVSTLTGSIHFLGSTGDLVFSIADPSTTIDGVTYTLFTDVVSGLPTNKIKIPNPAASGALGGCGEHPVTTCEGSLTLQGSVDAVPEPASMTLLGSGLLGAGSFLRRRLRKS